MSAMLLPEGKLRKLLTICQSGLNSSSREIGKKSEGEELLLSPRLIAIVSRFYQLMAGTGGGVVDLGTGGLANVPVHGVPSSGSR